MNDKLKKAIEFIRRNAGIISLTFTFISLSVAALTFFIVLNLRVVQNANAEVRLEQDLKTNTAQHKEFITQNEFTARIDAIQQVVNQTNQTVKVININVGQILQRQN